MPSLTVQRQAIERQRGFGVFFTWFGACGLALGLALVAYDPSRWDRWIWLLLPTFFVINGPMSIRKANRRLAEFIAEHGPDAGKRSRSAQIK